MGLGSAWGQIVNGKYGDAFSYLMVSDSTIETDRATDAKLSALNEKRREEGFYDPETYAAAQGHLQGGTIDQQLTNPETSPLGGFQQSIQDSVSGVSKGIQSVTSFSLGSVFRLIPWQVWAGLVIYGLFMTSALWLPVAKKSLAKLKA